MKRPALPALVLRVTLLVVSCSISLSQQLPSGASAAAARDVRFTPNLGQVVDVEGAPRQEIRYVSHSSGLSLYLAEGRISYVLTRTDGDLGHYRETDGKCGSHAEGGFDESWSEPVRHLHRIDIEFLGALPSPAITADRPFDGHTSYYLPHIPDGITGVRSFGRITYRNLYANIDFVIQSSGDRIKYDFVVHPGGRVSDIRLRYVGASGSDIAPDGSLVTTTSLGTLREQAPYSYQEFSPTRKGGATERREVSSRYRIADDTLSFLLGSYDSTRTLVIDPEQKWSTFYGGEGTEDMFGGDVTEVDRSGNCYFTGTTTSSTFPTSPGAFQSTVTEDLDIVVVKMSIGGKRLWATIYGGISTELAHGIVSDRNRNLFVAGHTISPDFPTYRAHDNTLGGVRDAFAIKFDSNGTRLWATFYGGDGFDDSYGFAIDSTGNPAMVGTTSSDDGSVATPGAFQTKYGGGVYDIFLVKFSSSGVRQWGTYYGGGGIEQGFGAATDIHDNINITGWTNSEDFPVTAGVFQTKLAGSYDAFVVRFNSTGTRQWGTYFGGTDIENQDAGVGTASIATDGAGNPVITGMTRSLDLPVSPGAPQREYGGGLRDAFVAMFDRSGQRLWATYCGGSRDDAGQGIASNHGNGVLVTGYTYSEDFPGITADAFSPHNAGGSDAFIVKLDSTGMHRDYVSYYGGGQDDFGHGISFDPFGSIVIAGTTASHDFPTTPDAFQSIRRNGDDAFLALFCDMGEVVVTADRPTTICRGDSITLSAPPGYAGYLWSSSSRSNFSTAESITVGEQEEYRVRVTNGAGCSAESEPLEVRWNIPPAPVAASAAGRTAICQGDSVTLVATTDVEGDVYWSNGMIGRSISVKIAGSYSAIIIDSQSGCASAAGNTIVVSVVPLPEVTVVAAPSTLLCEGGSVTLDAGEFASYLWRDSTNRILGNERRLVVSLPGSYSVEVRNNAGCSRVSAPVAIGSALSSAPVITLDGARPLICNGGRLVLRAGSFTSYLWRDSSGVMLGSADTLVIDRPGLYTLTVDNGVCSAVDSILIEEQRVVPISSIGDLVLCPGESALITAGQGYAQYRWARDGSILQGEKGSELLVRLPGTYTVHVTTTAGCSGIFRTTRVTINPGAATPLIGLVEDGLLSSAAASYQWSRNGIAIAGATRRLLEEPGDGIFTVSIIDSNGCSATSGPYRTSTLAGARVGFHEYSAAPGERISIPLMLAASSNLGSADVRSFTARIRFNRTMLHAIGGYLSDSTDGNETILTVGAMLPDGFTGEEGALLSLDFVALLGNAFETPIVVDAFEWDRPEVSISTFDGMFRTTGFCIDTDTRGIELAGMTRLMPPTPNPAHGITRIEFEVEEQGRTQLSLVDMMGRSIPILDSFLQPGVHVATFDMAEISSGAYYCILRTASQQRTQSMMIRK